jgi:hypothetical protein
MRVQNNVIPFVPLLGKQIRGCPRGWTYDMGCNCCIQTSGGGSARILRMPPVLFGAAAVPATAANETATYDPTTDPTTKQYQQQNSGFDIMQFVSDNALWLGLGVAGVIAIMLLAKPKRR